MISLIAAMSEQGVIGVHNRLPWRLPADMRWFREHTMGKAVIMGRNTFESIGKPLAGRTNIVVSRDPEYSTAGCRVAHSLKEALQAAREASAEVMVIGGASLYAQALPLADRIYLTLVHGRFEGDAWFPEYDPAEWRELERHDHSADEKNPHDYSFVILERREHPHLAHLGSE